MTLILSRMKKEAKELGINLKLYYANQASFYNAACLEGELHSSISSRPREP